MRSTFGAAPAGRRDDDLLDQLLNHLLDDLGLDDLDLLLDDLRHDFLDDLRLGAGQAVRTMLAINNTPSTTDIFLSDMSFSS